MFDKDTYNGMSRKLAVQYAAWRLRNCKVHNLIRQKACLFRCIGRRDQGPLT